MIHGIEIDEGKDLGYNLKLVRDSLNERLSFWGSYRQGLRGISKSLDTKHVHWILRSIYFLLLFPRYISFQFSKKKIGLRILEAEEELIAHYKLPETKVRQFRFECANEKTFYQHEIDDINTEIDLLKEKQNSFSISEHTKNELTNLLNAYASNLEQKILKYNFYKSCEDRLTMIEEQIMLQKSLKASKRKLLSLQDDESDATRLTEIKKEFELYDYYGDLLEDISTNLKKVNNDKEEKIRQAELSEMLSKIKVEESRN